MGDEEATRQIAQVLQDESALVRKAALEALQTLAELRGDLIYGPVVQYLGSRAQEVVRSRNRLSSVRKA